MTAQAFCRDCEEYDKDTRYCYKLESRTGPFVPACESFEPEESIVVSVESVGKI